jgi:hypothetical protein
MVLGAGVARAEAREVVCTVSPAQLPAPVTVAEGDQVQLVLIVDLLGTTTRVKVGPAQTATPGTEVLSATVTDVVGLAGEVCRAAVRVQAVLTSALPVPPLPSLPTLEPPPSESVQLLLPGVDVSVQTGGGTRSGPGTGDPRSGQPPAGGDPTSGQPATHGPSAPSGSAPGYRFGSGWMFSLGPYGLSSRFGPAAAPAFEFGQGVPGYAPQFGILDAENDAAGRVQVLQVGGRAAVALPVLLAVLMLATVSAALVRSWVLRRA